MAHKSLSLMLQACSWLRLLLGLVSTRQRQYPFECTICKATVCLLCCTTRTIVRPVERLVTSLRGKEERRRGSRTDWPRRSTTVSFVHASRTLSLLDRITFKDPQMLKQRLTDDAMYARASR